jgi:hypothetical protein
MQIQESIYGGRADDIYGAPIPLPSIYGMVSERRPSHTPGLAGPNSSPNRCTQKEWVPDAEKSRRRPISCAVRDAVGVVDRCVDLPLAEAEQAQPLAGRRHLGHLARMDGTAVTSSSSSRLAAPMATSRSVRSSFLWSASSMAHIDREIARLRVHSSELKIVASGAPRGTLAPSLRVDLGDAPARDRSDLAPPVGVRHDCAGNCDGRAADRPIGHTLVS